MRHPLKSSKIFVDENLDKTSDRYVNIIINRKNILSSTKRAIERGGFLFFQPVHITFAGEDGAGAGGPRREFFRLLVRSLPNLGVSLYKWSSHDLELLRTNKYELAGKLVG